MKIEGLKYENRKIGYNDNKRILFSVFDGDLTDFNLKQVQVMEACDTAVYTPESLDKANNQELLFMVKGGCTITLKDKLNNKEEYNLEARDKLIIPPKISYNIIADKGSIFIACTDGSYGKIGDMTENAKMRETVIFDSEWFKPKQISLSLAFKDMIIPGHYHHHHEFFYLIKGKALFGILNKAMKFETNCILEPDYHMHVELPNIYQIGLFKDSILVTFSERSCSLDNVDGFTDFDEHDADFLNRTRKKQQSYFMK